MATLVGSLIEAIGTKMAATFTGYSVIYGIPVANGMRDAVNEVRVHYMQEQGKFSGSQLGGVTTVSPLISVTVQRAFTSDSTLLATQQSTIDLGADLRLAISSLIMDHVTGTATIAAFAGQSLWVTDYTLTPSCMDIGAGQSIEAVTAEFQFNFSRSYGGR